MESSRAFLKLKGLKVSEETTAKFQINKHGNYCYYSIPTHSGYKTIIIVNGLTQKGETRMWIQDDSLLRAHAT